MSRSYRHTPIHGVTTARSEKEDKRLLNRMWRSRVRAILDTARRLDDEALDGLILPDRHADIMCIWSMAKDGRTWWGDRSWYSPRWPEWKIWRK